MHIYILDPVCFVFGVLLALCLGPVHVVCFSLGVSFFLRGTCS